jgi:hypothetical protein
MHWYSELFLKKNKPLVGAVLLVTFSFTATVVMGSIGSMGRIGGIESSYIPPYSDDSQTQCSLAGNFLLNFLLN